MMAATGPGTSPDTPAFTARAEHGSCQNNSRLPHNLPVATGYIEPCGTGTGAGPHLTFFPPCALRPAGMIGSAMRRSPPRGDIHGMFDGPVLAVTARIGTPILIGNILHLAYALVDTWFLSAIDRSSTAIMSGTGLVFPLFFLFMAIGMSLNVGLASLVGRAVGERNRAVVGTVARVGVVLALAIAVVLLLVGYLLGPFLVDLLAGDRLGAQARDYGLEYLRFLLPGLALMLVGQVFMGILQGEGHTGTIARAMTISTVGNMVLDPLLIFTFNMGVAGAGLATSLSMLGALVYVAGAYRAGRAAERELPAGESPRRGAIAAEIIRIGFPHFLSMAALAVSFMFLNKMVGSIGQGAMNAWILVARFNDAVLIPSFAVGSATMTMIAQNFGRGNRERVRSIYRANCVLAMVLVTVASLGYMAAAPFIFSRMSTVAAVVADAVRQVRLLSLTFVGIAAAIVSSSTFQATGRPLPATLLVVIRMGILAVPLSWVLVHLGGMGMDGIFWGMGVSHIVALPLSLGAVWLHLRERPAAKGATELSATAATPSPL